MENINFSPKLYKTTKTGNGRFSHYHYIYVPGPMNAFSSTDKKHKHQVVFSETGINVIEDTGHGHSIVEIELQHSNVVQETQDDIVCVENVLSLWDAAKAFEYESVNNALESERMYQGNQWEKNTKIDLKNKNRSALTINEIEPKIDLLSGYQRQNRSDITFYPVEEGDAMIAEILTELFKNIWSCNNAEMEETLVFEDEIIVGRGIFNVYEELDESLQKQIRIEHYPWAEVRFGPHKRIDLGDCEYCIKEKWLSKAKLKQLAPHKAGEIDADFKSYGLDKKGIDPLTGVVEYSKEHGIEDAPITSKYVSDNTPSKEYVDLAKQEYLLLECYQKEYKRVPILNDPDSNYILNISDIPDMDINSIQTIPGLEIVYVNKTHIKRTQIAGKVKILEEIIEGDTFPLFAVYAKKRDKYFWGKIEPVKDVQHEINKRHSQSIDILNKVATYGWFYDSRTFPNDKEKETFKKNSSSPGFLSEVLDTSHLPVQAEGVRYPSELANMETLSSLKLREIMNINLDFSGSQSNAQSGIAIVERKRQGLIGNDFLFDNLSATKRRLAFYVVRLIQSSYTPERILRILENRNEVSPISLGGMPMYPELPKMPAEVNPATMATLQKELSNIQVEIEKRRSKILELLSTIDITKYDIVAAESKFNPTTRQANFTIWAEIASKGFPVPPNVLIDLSDLPDKDKIKKEIMAMQQAEEQAELGKQRTEIQKTMIAKGNKPDTLTS